MRKTANTEDVPSVYYSLKKQKRADFQILTHFFLNKKGTYHYAPFSIKCPYVLRLSVHSDVLAKLLQNFVPAMLLNFLLQLFAFLLGFCYSANK